MKAQILEKLIEEHLEFGSFLRLVFTRVTKVMAVCLVLTLIVWLVWLGKYPFGSFLAGAAFGFLVFLSLCFLKRYLGNQKPTESSDGEKELGKLADPDGVRPKAPIRD